MELEGNFVGSNNDVLNINLNSVSTNLSAQEKVVELYKSVFGVVPDTMVLDGAGSDRKYFRLSAASSPAVIGTWGENIVENRSFVSLSEAFNNEGLPVPKIYAVDTDFSVYLQEDFGDCQLISLLHGNDRMRLSELSLYNLVRIQTLEENKWIDSVYMSPFSKRQVMWDLNYFKYEFLKPCGFIFDEDKLENDFESLASRLTMLPKEVVGFMYRDFQSRNIMIKDGHPYFIDFQGGRKGPLLYDAVSFLWQSKAGFTDEERMILLDKYASYLSKARNILTDVILKDVGLMALFRTLQVLGAYGFRGLVEKRSHFIESIPGALLNLKQLINSGELDMYPELKRVSEKAIFSRFSGTINNDRLTVKVFSFSYKKGYPEDLTGNGGGFMFDCRGMHNPGRYAEYKPLNGLDNPVRKFLEEKGEVQAFVENARSIVTPSIAKYQERGFKNLQIGFGCTGGRHRSVYCAQALAEQLSVMFPNVVIILTHREQGLSQVFNK